MSIRSHSLVSDRHGPGAGVAGRDPASYSPLPTGLQRPLVGHADELAALRQSLRLQGFSGSVLVGAPGVGKTSLLRAAQESLPGEYFVRVRGLQSAAALPYRALKFLLAQIPEELSHPPLLPTALAVYLRERAAGRPLVFAVDNGEYLDAASATLIGQLVTNGTARLVLTVRDFAQLDPVFAALWRGGTLNRLEVGPLSVPETRQLLEAELGAPVSREALDAVWDAGQGNPEASRNTLLGLVEQGALARRGPAWVLLADTPDTPDTPDTDAVRGRTVTAALPPSEREVLTLLALAGPSPWAHLIRLVGAQHLDALQGRGLLTVELQRHPVFSVAGTRLVRDLLEETTAAEAAALYSRYTAVAGAARQLEADPVRRVTWALKAGLPVDQELLLVALRTLNDDGRYARAARLLQQSRRDDHVVAPAVALQGAVAALGQGRQRSAEIFGLTLATVGEQPDPALWVRCRIQLSRIQRRRSTQEAAETLDAAAHRIAALGDAADAEALPQLLRLDLLLGAEQADLASFEGQYRENLFTVPVLLEQLSASPAGEDRELQLGLQSLLLEAQALVDQHPAGTELLQSFTANLSAPDVSHRSADAALQRVELAALLAGGWSEGARLLKEMSLSSQRWSLRQGSLAELVEALTLLTQDNTREAVRVLGPVVEQLRESDSHGFLPAAAAALTYCHAQLESREQMIAHLPLSNAGAGRPWLVRRAAQHYQLLSTTGAVSRGDAARRLQDRAPDDLELGATGWALTTLAAAVRMGRLEAIEDLQRVADTLHGPLARTCSLYARALLTADRHLLVEAIELAVAAGSYRFAKDIAQSGIAAATRAQDRATVRFLQRRLKQLLPEDVGRAEAHQSFEALTAREREIALLTASGHTNKMIAEKLFVSVRTIEGHLYQVYSKLNVSTRAELAECIPPRAAP